jgi:cytidine deaminase
MSDFIVLDSLEALDAGSRQLVHEAQRATLQAYAPYSRFTVGAAMLLDNGVIVTGSNQENAAYPSGMCAERVALYAKAAQYPGVTIKKMVIIACRAGSEELVSAAPCGSCRQVMLEFEHRQDVSMEVVFQGPSGEWIKAPSATSLLPFAFSKDNL